MNQPQSDKAAVEVVCCGCGGTFERARYYVENRQPGELDFCSPECAKRHAEVAAWYTVRLRIVHTKGVKTEHYFEMVHGTTPAGHPTAFNPKGFG